MADQIIRPSALPNRENPVASEKVPVDNGSTVGGATIEALVLAGRPTASQFEAEAGVDALKAMTPLTTKQAVTARIGVDIASKAQGDKADSAIQSIGQGSDITVDATDPQNPIVSYTGGGVTDGDKGDIFVSGSGAVWRLKQRVVVASRDAAAGLDLSGETEIIVNRWSATSVLAPALYEKVAQPANAEPAHDLKFQDLNGLWFEIAERRVSATMCGAEPQGYGSSDAHTGIQRLVNYLSQTVFGGDIYIPSGKWLLGAQINVPKDFRSYRLIGDGWDTVINVGDPDLSYGFYFGQSSEGGRANYRVEDIMFVGADGQGRAIAAEYANGIVFDNVCFQSLRRGITFNETYAPRVLSCRFDDCKDSAIISLSPCYNLYVGDGTFFLGCHDMDAYPFGATIVINGDSVNTVIEGGCDIEACGNILFLGNGGSGVHRGVSIKDNYIEGNEGQIVTTTGTISNLRINDNHLNLNGIVDYDSMTLPGSIAFPPCTSGEFKRNNVYQTAVTFDAQSYDVDVAFNVPDETATIAVAPWRLPALGGDYVSGDPAVGYKRFSDGTVRFHGYAHSGTINETVFTLPPGFRPDFERRVPVVSIGGTLGFLRIFTTGEVSCSLSDMFMDGVSFTAKN